MKAAAVEREIARLWAEIASLRAEVEALRAGSQSKHPYRSQTELRLMRLKEVADSKQRVRMLRQELGQPQASARTTHRGSR